MTDRKPFIPEAVRSLAPFVDAGILGAAEVHTAEIISRVSSDPSDELLLATALAVRAPSLGHVCLGLGDIEQITVVDQRGAENDQLDDLVWPDASSWISALEASDVVRGSDESSSQVTRGHTAPLVLDGDHLYLDRYWNYERRVIAEISRRAETMSAAQPEDQSLLDRLFGTASTGTGAGAGAGAGDSQDRQRMAAETALTHNLSVVAGGPGTGKTYTVARLLAAFHARAAASGAVPQVALAAPTGKAAARMTEAIREAADQLDLDEVTVDGLRSAEASTLHRLLGSSWGNTFRHNRTNPLPHDIVVVDETSMVSLPLMFRLLDAVRPDASLVLVGDPYQLRSIEAGTVLGDIVGLGGPIDQTRPLASGVTTLERVHRFASESPIAALADAVREGDSARALGLLSSGSDGPGGADSAEMVTRVDPSDVEAMAALDERVIAQARTTVEAATEGQAETSLERSLDIKVLCATREGPGGVSDWNDRVETRLRADEIIPARATAWYRGRAVMIRRNDYATGVFNGDVGVMVDVSGRAQVAVQGSGGIRFLEPAQLDEVDTWWAMTIHKSQGSEFDEIIISLPAESAVLSRELLYTAVTRARSRVTIVATEETLVAAINHPITRASGLRRALWGDIGSAHEPSDEPVAPSSAVADPEELAKPVEPDKPTPVKPAKKVRKAPKSKAIDKSQLTLFSTPEPPTDQ